MAKPGEAQDYMNNLGRYPVLTPEAQLHHSRRIHKWINWPDGRDQAPPLVRKRGERSMNAMVITNARLVVSIAKKYQNCGMDFSDLIQEGNLGLIRGLEMYDPSRGYAVSTYTYWWIRQGITRALLGQSRMIRLPVHCHELISRVQRYRQEHTANHGTAPTIDQIAEALKLKPARLRTLLDQYAVTQCVSSDILVAEGDTPLIELIGGPDPLSPVLAAEDTEISDLVQEALQFLPENEAIVLRRHTIEGHTLGTIGETLGVSRSRAGQLFQSATRRVRAHVLSTPTTRG
jgi:RNA polymerase nonessential primary-like sigma factor